MKFPTIKRMRFAELFTLPTNLWSNLQNKITLKLQQHRLSTRVKLQIKPLKTVTFLSLLPFFLGFWYFVQQKYPLKKTNLLFDKNLPGISVPTEKLDWETFQYILKYNKFTSATQNFTNLPSAQNTIYWTDRYIIIQHENINPLSEKNPEPLIQQLVATIKNKSQVDHLFGFSRTLKSDRYIFSLNPKKPNILYKYQGDLDEIPSKLESAYEATGLQWNTKELNFKGIVNLSTDTLFVKTRPISKKIFLKSAPKTLNFLIAVKTPTLTKIFQGKPYSQIVSKSFENNKTNKNFLKPYLYQKQQEIVSRWNLFDQEIRKVFMKTEFIPVSSNKTFIPPFDLGQFIKGSALKHEELKWIKELLVEINDISVPAEFTRVRLMSGYCYPDMGLDEVREFDLHQNFSSTQNTQITLPASYSIAETFGIPELQFPEFLIKTKNLILKNFQDQSLLYQGPGIVLNSQNGLDWEIQSTIKTNQTLRSWVEKYLRSENPLSDSLENFGRIIDLPNNLLPQENATKDYWVQTLPLFRNGIISNTNSSVLPFERSFQLPVLSNKEWQAQLDKHQERLKASDESASFLEKALPLFEIRIPQLEKPQFLFGLHPSVDYTFASPITSANQTSQTRQKSSLRPTFLPEVSSYLAQETFGNQYSSGVYKKLTSLFGQKPSLLFQDLWEPLTFHSWLVVSQIGFAFLVFRILKALADNYGRELLVYLLDLVALLGFLDENLKQEIEILMGQREKGFRIIFKTRKNFTDIAGIQNLLPEVVEIVWFLRNSGREFSLSKTLPRGVLLTGPPGTGKTLLVQALAGEAEVPVLALSGSSLLEPGESGALKLEILFQEARRLAPCIVFIDEMDTLAQKRDQVLQNPMGADEVLESFHDDTSSLTSTKVDASGENSSDPTETMLAQQDMQREKLRILMQFLVELDGIQGRDGVVVIGATNRPEMLDPAIVRPGRFDRVLELGLPGPEKRQEILKLYSQNIGVTKDISWNYLTHRTAGYSAADLASIMNQSSLRAIMIQSCHSVETIEHGIDRITTSGIENSRSFSKPGRNDNKKAVISEFSTLRLAYYQAGKIVLSTLLEHHPPTLVTHLWPRRTNVRALQIAANLQKYFFRFARRVELEHRIIGCYAGKAAEILLLQSSTFESNLSDLGIEDIQFAQNLVECMIQKWYLYSKTIPSKNTSSILTTKNIKEYRESPEKIPVFNQFLENFESLNSQGFSGVETTQQSFSKQMEVTLDQQPQSYFPVAWWQYQISDEFEVATRHFSDWYRLYLPDPQENERNLEWSPPDEFYHGNDLLEHLTESTTWNDISRISAEYQVHSLILQSFNKAFTLLDEHREVLDKVAYELVQREILREPEIEEILAQFKLPNSINKKASPFSKNVESQEDDYVASNKKIVSSYWGVNSRRQFSNWLDLSFFQQK